MAILAFDGFDHYNSQADLQSRVGVIEWSDIALSLFSALSFAPGRGGYGRSLVLTGGQDGGYHIGGSFSSNLAAGFLGFALLFDTPSVVSADIRLQNYPGIVPTLVFRLYPNSGVVQVFSSDPDTSPPPSPLVATAPNAFSPYVWNFFEVCWSASGGFDLHVNGNSVIAGSTGVAGAVVNGVQVSILGAPNAGSNLQIDDFYLCDTTAGPGTFPCNSFLGDSAVRTLYPTANSSVQWAPLASTNWVEVGESQFDGDTSYNAATTVGATDLFTFGSLPTTVSAVFGVQLTGAYRKQDAGANTIVQKVVSGGTTASGAPKSLSLQYGYFCDLLSLDPHTGATWTPTAVNALVAGYTLNS